MHTLCFEWSCYEHATTFPSIRSMAIQCIENANSAVIPVLLILVIPKEDAEVMFFFEPLTQTGRRPPHETYTQPRSLGYRLRRQLLRRKLRSSSSSLSPPHAPHVQRLALHSPTMKGNRPRQ